MLDKVQHWSGCSTGLVIMLETGVVCEQWVIACLHDRTVGGMRNNVEQYTLHMK